MSDWKRDHTLASACATSWVWRYQTLAGRVGTERYRRHLDCEAYDELGEPLDLVAFCTTAP